MKPHSQKFLRQRKFFMVLPLLVLPFVTLFFWALGGGKGVPAQAQDKKYSGLNLELPSAIFSKEDENWNKFDLYEKAKRDSLKYQRAKKNDPYYEVMPLLSLDQSEKEDLKVIDKKSTDPDLNKLNTSLGKKEQLTDPIEAQVNEKLEQLTRELEGNNNQYVDPKDEVDLMPSLANSEESGSEIDRLEAMMLMIRDSREADPEMQQIESVLEKILDIQHPDRVKEKIKEKSLLYSKQVFPVNKKFGQDDISLLANKSSYQVNAISQTQNGFYGLEDDIFQDQQAGNAIEAVIHYTQELMAGSTVKLRLLNDIYINGKLIAKDQFIYGTCNVNGERLTIDIKSMRTNNSLFPVSLSAYDLDGLEGIYIPGAIARDVAKQSTNQAIQGMDFISLDPSVTAQATNAGIQAAKTLLSKKTKAVKVTVKAGYKVLLHDANLSS